MNKNWDVAPWPPPEKRLTGEEATAGDEADGGGGQMSGWERKRGGGRERKGRKHKSVCCKADWLRHEVEDR